MHNIDRTLQEYEYGAATSGEFESFETSGEYEQEQEFGHEFGHEFSGEYEASHEQEQTHEVLAGQLLEVSSEQELNQFLGGLVSQVAGAGAKLLTSPAGQSVGRFLTGVAKDTLPQLGAKYGAQLGGALGGRAGAALGGRLGPLGAQAGQWAGQTLGRQAGQQAGQWAGQQAANWAAGKAKQVFGLELEALSPESQELEINRAYVRFASDVARRAERALRRYPTLSPGALGRQVLGASVPLYAPGLFDAGVELRPAGPVGRARSGSWVRQNGAIVLYGA